MCVSEGGLYCISLIIIPPPIMVLGMCSETAGTLGGWRGALLIPPFPFFLHSAFLTNSSSFLFLSKTGLRPTFFQRAAWVVLFLFMQRPHTSCMLGKTLQVETRCPGLPPPPPKLLSFLYRKGSPAVLQLFERGCLWEAERQKEMWQHQKPHHLWYIQQPQRMLLGREFNVLFQMQPWWS